MNPLGGNNVAGAAVFDLAPVAMGRNLECGHFAPAAPIWTSSGTQPAIEYPKGRKVEGLCLGVAGDRRGARVVQ